MKLYAHIQISPLQPTFVSKFPTGLAAIPDTRRVSMRVPTDLVAPEGTPIYTVTEETVEVVEWHHGKKKLSTFAFKEKNKIKTYETYGTGYGFYIQTSSNSGVRLDAHLDPAAESTQAWGRLLDEQKRLAKEYGSAIVPKVVLPPNVELGRIGLTGNTTGAHVHHEGLKKISPYKPYSSTPIQRPSTRYKVETECRYF